MALLVWSMVGIALWHFTVFLPDHFWGGIVGAFLGALVGAVLMGLIVNGFGLPAREDIDLVTAFESIPGTLIGLGAAYLYGLSREKSDPSYHR